MRRAPVALAWLLAAIVAADLPRRTVLWPGWFPASRPSYCRADLPGCCPVAPKRILFLHQPKASGTTLRMHMIAEWQKNTGKVACTADRRGTKFYEDSFADAGGAAAVRLEFLSGGVFANCDIVSTHIDASLLDALPPEILAETLVVWNAREPFARLVSEYSHNYLWPRSTNAATLKHVTFDEFAAATYEPPPPASDGTVVAAAAVARDTRLKSLVGDLPSMVLRHGGLRLSNPMARRLTGFTAFGQAGADSWASAPVPAGQPPRPGPGFTGPVVPMTSAVDTGGDDLLAAAVQRLQTRVCAVVVTELLDDGIAFIHSVLGWPPPPAHASTPRRNTAKDLGRIRNVTARELAAGLEVFAVTDRVDEALYRLAQARHHLQVDALEARRRGTPALAPARDSAELATVATAVLRDKRQSPPQQQQQSQKQNLPPAPAFAAAAASALNRGPPARAAPLPPAKAPSV